MSPEHPCPRALPATPRAAAAESGAAYIAVLLVVLVLSTLAVALTFVSATEMQIGANERTVQRTLGAAESGIGIGLARMLVTADYSSADYALRATADEDPGGPLRIGTRVEVGRLVPLVEAPCNLCQINEAGSYGSATYSRVNVDTTNTGVRGNGLRRVGERTVTAVLDVQPVQVPTSAYFPDEAE